MKEAVIAFNTLVGNKSSLAIGVRGGKKTLPPQDCLIVNNIVVSAKGPLVHEFTAPVRLEWEGNLMFGAPLGIPPPAGVRVADPLLRQGADGLWRPGAGSPAWGAAVGDFPFVKGDIDAPLYARRRDVGCDERSSRPPVHHVLTRGDVGPAWPLDAALGPGR